MWQSIMPKICYGNAVIMALVASAMQRYNQVLLNDELT